MMCDPIGDPAAGASFKNGAASALCLPGRGFSLWVRAICQKQIVQPTQARPTTRGFSLPDPNDHHTKHLSPCPQRGFSRTYTTAPAPRTTEPSEPVPKRCSPPRPVVVDPPLLSKPDPTTVSTLSSPSSPPAHSNALLISDTMTSPTKLPGNGFSVWTNRTLPLVALQLSEPTVPANLTLASAPETVVSDTAAKVHAFESVAPTATSKKGSGSLFRWAAALLIGSTLAAFLSSEGKRKDLVTEVGNLTETNGALEIEKTTYLDNWKLEEQKSAALSENIKGLEKNLSDSRANVVALTAQKEGLGKTIDELRNALAMTVEEMKNTEASLNKVIASLEAKNKEISTTLAQETSKLEKLGAELADVKGQLEAQKASNEKLVAENQGLSEKVSQLQSSLDKTIKDAQDRENSMREQIGTLEKTNQELASSLEAQKKELKEVKDKLQASEADAVASEKEGESSQSQLNDLSRQLDEAVASRDAMESEKRDLAISVSKLSQELEHQKAAPSTEALQQEINTLKANGDDAATQIKALKQNREELLHRNSDLQTSVQQLNSKLSSLAEKEGAEEAKLTERIKTLMADNELLKQSLETQKSEFQALLKQSGDYTQDQKGNEVSGALQDLKDTLGQSLRHGRETDERLRAKNEQFSNTLVAHTNEILNLSTRISQADDKIAASQRVLKELESLRQQVKVLRTQGSELENELTQRVTHISTLNASKNTWKEETLKLRSLLESESEAQAKLATFVAALQERIGDLEAPAEVALSK